MVTCEEMKKLEQMADEAGLSYYQMMENAGTCAADLISENCGALAGGGSAAIFCGKGNNGGDGFVVARLLAQRGAKVTVILVEGEPETPDAITNYGLLADMRNVRVTGSEAFDAQAPLHEQFDAIVDAVYGTGFHGELRPDALSIVKAINAAHENGVQVTALDLPSGLSGNAGENDEIGPSVIADATITFHDTKPIHFNKKAMDERLGKVTVGDIGIGKAIGADTEL